VRKEANGPKSGKSQMKDNSMKMCCSTGNGPITAAIKGKKSMTAEINPDYITLYNFITKLWF
jgi:hypothetical protein